MPKVSIIVPNYNHAKYLERRLTSVWEQTYRDTEVLYLDDASTDNSAKVLEALLVTHPEHAARTRVINNTANSGSPFKQWNKGAREAKGEFLWFAEADDYAEPTLLENLVARMEANPQVGISYCQSWAVDANNEVICSALDFLVGGPMPPLDKTLWQQDFTRNGQEECRRHLICRNMIPNASAVLLRRSVFEAVGGADETFRLAGDWMLWVKMLLRSDLAFTATPLNHFRLHQKSVSHATKVNGIEAEENYRIAGEIMQTVDIEPMLKEKVLASLLDGWLRPALHGQANISSTQHRKIYRMARTIDPHLKRRFLRRTRQATRYRAHSVINKLLRRKNFTEGTSA